MAEKKADRRTLKTKKAICDAFAELLAEKQLNKITVQEIADKADVNRVTFYNHYLDVYDLYDKIEEEVLIELGLLILQLDELRRDDFYSCLIGYIDDHRSLFRMMFSPNGTNHMREKFSKIMEGLFRKLICEQKDMDIGSSGVEYFSCYRAQGCIAIIEKWIQNGLSESKEHISNTLSELDRNTEDFILRKTNDMRH